MLFQVGATDPHGCQLDLLPKTILTNLTLALLLPPSNVHAIATTMGNEEECILM